jgi:putative phage-type endonuclease
MNDELMMKAAASATASVFGVTEAPTEETMEQRRNRWLEDRRKAIGATDLAKILGLAPKSWGGPMSVWLAKTGALMDEDFVMSEEMEMGLELEETILRVYAKRTGHEIVRADPYDFRKVPGSDILGASFDARRAGGDRRPVDAKNVGYCDPSKGWGEPGTDQIPKGYLVQLHVQMMVDTAPYADLAVLERGQKFRCYEVDADLELHAFFKETAENFWLNHVIADIPPEVDGSDDWSHYLGKMDQATKMVKDPTPEQLEEAKRLFEIRTTMAALEDEQKAIENRLKQAIGEASGLKGIATWNQTKGRVTTRWEELARKHINEKDLERLIPEFTAVGNGYRTFRFNFKGE